MRFGIWATSTILPKNFRSLLRPVKDRVMSRDSFALAQP
jgi:hypothetical protein